MPKVVIAVRVDQDLKDELLEVAKHHQLSFSSACEKILKHGNELIGKAKKGNQVGLNLSLLLGHSETLTNSSRNS